MGEEGPAKGGGKEADEFPALKVSKGCFVERVRLSFGWVFGVHGVRVLLYNGKKVEKFRESVAREGTSGHVGKLTRGN